MKRLLVIFISIVVICLTSNAQSVATLNNLFATYSENITLCSARHPDANSCYIQARNMKAELQGKKLVLFFVSGDDRFDGWYIEDVIMKIDLSTATFCTGMWSNMNMTNTWKQTGKREVLSIADNNGIEYYYLGRKDSNKDTKQTLLSAYYISFGTEPIANRVLNEIYKIQERYKAKEPWLLPEPEPQQEATASQKKNTSKNSNNNKPSGSNTPKTVGKYVQ